MFVAVTNDGGFYQLKDEGMAVNLATLFDIDFNEFSYNIFEVNPDIFYFTGIAYTKAYLDSMEKS